MTWTLITGASRGIGFELAKCFAEDGHNLILIARDVERLKKVSTTLEKDFSVRIRPISSDLAKEDSCTQLTDLIASKGLQIDYLVNNAAYYVKGQFDQTDIDDETGLIRLQTIVPVQLTKALLPGMLNRHKGGILNVASTGSYVPGPYNAVYCASKGFVLSFTDAIAEELKDSPLLVSSLIPGGTNTDFQDLSSRRSGWLAPLSEPSYVARRGYEGFMSGKRRIIPGWQNQLVVCMVRMAPRNWMAKMAARAVRSETEINLKAKKK